MDAQVAKLARASTDKISQWKFTVRGDLYVDDCDIDAHVGDLDYENMFYEIGAAVRLRSWVFALERQKDEIRKVFAPENSPKTWVIGGYHGESHYSFVGTNAEFVEQRTEALLYFVVQKIVPILYPDIFDSLGTNSKKKKHHLGWEIKLVA